MSSTRLRLSWRSINETTDKRNGETIIDCFFVLRDVKINRQMSGTHRNSQELMLSLRFRSMSACPRYHGPRVWARDRRDTVRWAVRTLPRALGGEDRSPDWSGPGWRSSHQWRPVRRSEPRRFTSAPPRRPFMGSSEPGRWRPHYCEEERRSNWQRPPVQRPGDWRISPDPTERPARRGDQGPPLAPARVVE